MAKDDMEGECVLSIDWAHKMVVLKCSNIACLAPRPFTGDMRPLEIPLPDDCLPETAVLIRKKHLASHDEQAQPS